MDFKVCVRLSELLKQELISIDEFKTIKDLWYSQKVPHGGGCMIPANS